jgi:uncharacterized protein with ParB-like and HNH nuclease domain
MVSENVEELRDEADDSYSNDDLYNINSWGADLSFRELITMYDEDELIKPELQRQYVWDKVEASRFIESLLLGLPVPSIFLANTDQNTKLIIDGYQRIMTVYDYLKGIWSKDNSVFMLSNSEKINKRWRGKSFSQLSTEEQRKIRSTTIHSIIFEQVNPKNDDTSLYQIFERINTGGRALVAQEIRNCVYQGSLNKLLFELNSDYRWRELFGSDKDDRMRDMEFILRFFALNNDDILKHKKGNISLKKLLNEFMGRRTNNSDEVIDKLRNDFLQVINFVYENIGQNAFFNIVSSDVSKIRKRFYPTVFDSVCIATLIALKHGPINSDNLEEKRLNLLKNTTFKKYISEGTMQAESIQGRVFMALECIYGIHN